ncbi:hypothetical protein ACFU3O_12915 [Streptomyces antibioticus]|uniref:hypothetical protein n=1 Tax=Streptomyces antibioticus TaxID=1890 RepID=UPI0036A02C8F
MSGRRKPAPELEEGPSRLAGGCVLVVLAGVVVAVLFAVDEAVGVLAVVGVGWVALYRAARRVSGLSAPPPPPSTGTVYAAQTDEIERVQKGPGEGMTILYPVREETLGE